MQLSKNTKHILFIITIGVVVAVCVFVLIYKIKKARKSVNMSADNNNVQAFLKMIRHAEGTAGANGYRTLFGGRLFDDYSKHPNVCVPFYNKAKGKQDCSTAAGAYQFLNSTWKRLALTLGLDDFSPQNQDKAAVELIREKGALNDVLNGNFETAVNKIAKVWASMPGAGYKQPEKKLAELLNVYKNNGGQLA